MCDTASECDWSKIDHVSVCMTYQQTTVHCNTRADTNEMTRLSASFCGAQAINMGPESCQSTPQYQGFFIQSKFMEKFILWNTRVSKAVVVKGHWMFHSVWQGKRNETVKFGKKHNSIQKMEHLPNHLCNNVQH